VCGHSWTSGWGLTAGEKALAEEGEAIEWPSAKRKSGAIERE